MPEWLEAIQNEMKEYGGKYICGKSMTVADISTFSIMFKTCSNDKFEHNLICLAIVEKYPKVKAWLALMEETFKDYMP